MCTYTQRSYQTQNERKERKSFQYFLFECETIHILHNCTDKTISRAGMETQMWRTDVWTWGGGWGVVGWIGKLGLTYVHVCAKLLQSCLTICDPEDCSSPGSPVHGILKARKLEWVAMLSSRGSIRPRDRTCISYVCCTGRWVLYC